MIRAYGYLAVAGFLWISEAVLFGHFLKMRPWQLILLATIYVALFCVACRYLLISLRSSAPGDEFFTWRLVSQLPMLVVIVGSFAALPLVALVVVLGNL